MPCRRPPTSSWRSFCAGISPCCATCSRRRAHMCFWHRRRSRCFASIRSSPNTLQERRRAASLRRVLHTRRCRARRTTSFRRRSRRRTWRRSSRSPITSYSTPSPSGRSTASSPSRTAVCAAFASTPSIRRRSTRSTIHARSARVSASSAAIFAPTSLTD